MHLARIHTAIEEAISESVNSIQLPGIVDAAVRNVAVTSQHLQQVATHLERHGQSEIRLSADVELFLRISSSDVLSSIQCVAFRVSVNADTNNLRATASAEENWGAAWERGIEPIRQAALQSMKEDIWNLDATLTEDSYTFSCGHGSACFRRGGDPTSTALRRFLSILVAWCRPSRFGSMKRGFGKTTKSAMKAGSIPKRYGLN